MAWDFKPGMRVVCVKVDGIEEVPPPYVQVGGVYTIDRTYIAPDGDLMLELVEVPSPATSEWMAGFYADFFRPVREANIDSLRAHLAPRPLVRERA